MTWSKFDDLYDEHEKVEDAWEQERATIGLHAMATTHCSRQRSDGVVTPRWIRRKLPNARERERVLATLVEVGLFDLLPAGEARTLIDRDGDEVIVGPYDEDRYLVHDYLHHNDSVAKHTRNREWDRRRKELERDRELVGAIRKRDGDRCRYCAKLVDWKDRRSPKGGTYDHVTPRGENTLANVVVACRGCNQRKGARTPEEAGTPLLPPGGLEQNGQVPARSRPDSGQVRSTHPTRPNPTQPTSPPSPPRGNRTRDRVSFEETATAWAATAGVTGDPARLLRAYGQAGAWQHPNPAEHFRGFCRQHFPTLTIEEETMAPVHPLPERAA